MRMVESPVAHWIYPEGRGSFPRWVRKFSHGLIHRIVQLVIKPHLNFKTPTKILKIVLKWLCHTYKLSNDLAWLQFILVNPWRQMSSSFYEL